MSTAWLISLSSYRATVANMIVRIALWIVLIACGTDAFAQAQTSPESGSIKYALLPHRYMCLDLLQLESLEVKSDGTVGFSYTQQDSRLLADYNAVIGWLQGYFTALNFTQHGDLTKNTRPVQWMTWIFSYCRTKPSGTLLDAADQLGKAFLGNSK